MTATDAEDRDTENAAPTRFIRVRRYARSLNHIGVFMALVFFYASLTPSLLPRPWLLQGLVSGIAAAGGYGLGVTVSWVLRHSGLRQPGARVRRLAWLGLGVFAAVTVPVILWLSASWQQDIRRALGAPVGSRDLYIGVFTVAAATSTGLIGVARLFHGLYLIVTEKLRRYLPRTAARLTAAALIAVLTLASASGVVYRVATGAADLAFAASDRGDPADVVQPVSADRSGSPASAVPWRTLGKYGRAFVGSGPSPGQISALTRRPAVEPIRVFAGLDSAPTLQAEADLVLAELKRTHAFDRSLLAVATTTGRGRVDPMLADPLEYMYGGDTAIAAMQYSHLPSWISFLVDETKARQAGRDLFDTVYDYWATLPADHRPRLVVFGESLGAFGADAAFSGVAELTNRNSGALFVGPPNSTTLWRELTDKRVPGSPEYLPVYGDGQTVRFAGTAADLREPDGVASHPRAVYLQHASDPIVWWSTDLIWRKPAWLSEPRGPDVTPAVHWYPFVTFWQLTCDMAVGLNAPAGHGHHYGSEIIASWTAILQPPGWTDADTAALAATPLA